jgi:hypothetical protein
MGEAGASPRGGLSAAELATETLFPGDTIEYFSMVRGASLALSVGCCKARTRL